MRVYHGSAVEIPQPGPTHSKRFLDFGPGFYVTTFRKQAERWARSKCDRLRGPASPILNIYELDEAFIGFDILRFDGAEGKDIGPPGAGVDGGGDTLNNPCTSDEPQPDPCREWDGTVCEWKLMGQTQ